MLIRESEDRDLAQILAVVNDAAQAYRVDFYRRNRFTVVPNADKDRLLRTYWSIPERQIETSVVLADGRWTEARRSREVGR